MPVYRTAVSKYAIQQLGTGSTGTAANTASAVFNAGYHQPQPSSLTADLARVTAIVAIPDVTTARVYWAEFEVPNASNIVPTGTIILSGQVASGVPDGAIPTGALTIAGQVPAAQTGLPTGAVTLAGQVPAGSPIGTLPTGGLTITGQAPAGTGSGAVPTGALTLAGQVPGAATELPTGAITLSGKAPVTPSVTLLTSGASGTNLSTYTTASVTPLADHLLILAVVTTLSGTVIAPTVTGNGLTWTLRATNAYDTAGTQATLFVFTASGASPSAGVITIDYAGVVQAGTAWMLHQSSTVTGILQQANASTASGTTLTPTLGAAITANSLTLSYVSTQVDEAFTTEAGWTDSGRTSHLGPTISLGGEYQITGTDTSAGWTWTTASIAGAIILEFGLGVESVPTGAITLTGQVPASATALPTGALTLAGQVPSVATTLPTGALTLAGQTPLANATGTVPTGALTLSGQVPAAATTLPVGALTLTGQTPLAGARGTAPAGAITLAGQAPSVATTLLPTGAITLSGQTPTATASATVPTGAIILTGQAPIDSGSPDIVPTGAITLAGQVPGSATTLPTGTLTISGNIPVASARGAVPAGSLSITGQLPAPGTTLPSGGITVAGQVPVAGARGTVPTGAIVISGKVPGGSSEVIVLLLAATLDQDELAATLDQDELSGTLSQNVLAGSVTGG